MKLLNNEVLINSYTTYLAVSKNLEFIRVAP